MTRVFFVRHAQPEHNWKDDRTRPLTREGKADSKIVLDFLRIIDWMPYVIELDFEGDRLVSQKEHCHVEKEFKGKARADKK